MTARTTLRFLAAVEVYPEAKVLVTALAGDDDRTYAKGLATFDRLMARGMGRYFDIGNFPYYERTAGEFEARLERRYDEYKAVLHRHRADKPIWITETSTSSDAASPVSGPSSEQVQARHVVQRAAVFFGRGAEKVFWHSYARSHENNKFRQCNLVHPRTKRPKPAYHTFRLLVRKLGFFRSVERIGTAGPRVYRFVKPDGKSVIVAWDRTEGTIDLSRHLTGPRAKVTHIIEAGEPPPKEGTAESTRVPVSPSPVFVEEL